MGFTLKGRDVIKLQAIAAKTGKPYGECFAEIVGRAHEAMFGASEGEPGTPAPAPTSPANESPLDRKARHDAINAAAGAEDRSPKSMAKAQKTVEQVGEPHDGSATEDSSNEHQDSPVMKGSKPNPLAVSAAKRWAASKDDDDEEEEPKKKPVTPKKPGFLRGKK